MIRPAVLFIICGACSLAQERANFRGQAFGGQSIDRSPLLAADFPDVSLLLANRNVELKARRSPREVLVRALGFEATFVLRFERQGVFDFCRIRHQPGTPIPAEELKLIWASLYRTTRP